MCLALYVAGQDFQLQLQHIKHYGFSPWFPLHFPVSNLSPHLQHLWYSTAAPKVMVRSGVPFEEMKSVCDYELFIWHSEILLNEECVTNKMNYYYLFLHSFINSFHSSCIHSFLHTYIHTYICAQWTLKYSLTPCQSTFKMQQQSKKRIRPFR